MVGKDPNDPEGLEGKDPDTLLPDNKRLSSAGLRARLLQMLQGSQCLSKRGH